MKKQRSRSEELWTSIGKQKQKSNARKAKELSVAGVDANPQQMFEQFKSEST